MTRNRPLLITLAALGLAACGESETSDNRATANGEAGDPMNQMMNDPNNPFAQSEMTMNARMVAAVGVDAADTWVRKMIEHHQGAIDMSRIFLQQGASGDAATLARQTIAKQGREIDDLRKLIRQGRPNPQSAEIYRPSMEQMHQAMMAARGSELSQTFLRKMLEHHRGGVTLSDAALNNGVAGEVRTIVQKTRESQAKEAELVEAMLRGEPMTQVSPEAEPEPAAATKPSPAPPSTKREATPAQPAPKSKAAPKTTKDPAPAPSTCTPEHRAMGHC